MRLVMRRLLSDEYKSALILAASAERSGVGEVLPLDFGAALRNVLTEEYQPFVGMRRLGQLLSVREREIADLMTRGFTIREIAEALSLSEEAVRNHYRNMLAKLGIFARGPFGSDAGYLEKHDEESEG
jgi:DNA-binding NarL/FixJ family response regulator